MKGYHTRPRRTRRRSSPTAASAPATSASVDADGYLFITGRIKEQYKLENGKYVMPAPLEEQLKLSPYIANVMLYGADKPYNVALVVLDAAAVREWAAEQGIDARRRPRPRTRAVIELIGRARPLRRRVPGLRAARARSC